MVVQSNFGIENNSTVINDWRKLYVAIISTMTKTEATEILQKKYLNYETWYTQKYIASLHEVELQINHKTFP